MRNETTFEYLNYRWLKKNDKKNSIVYNPVLFSDGHNDLVYIDMSDCHKIFDRNSLYANVIDAVGTLNLWNLFLPTLNTFETLNLDVAKYIEEKYSNPKKNIA
ncbi:hypothetical protein ACO0R3_000797 [Hanseniaspora guilliermondii]